MSFTEGLVGVWFGSLYFENLGGVFWVFFFGRWDSLETPTTLSLMGASDIPAMFRAWQRYSPASSYDNPFRMIIDQRTPTLGDCCITGTKICNLIALSRLYPSFPSKYSLELYIDLTISSASPNWKPEPQPRPKYLFFLSQESIVHRSCGRTRVLGSQCPCNIGPPSGQHFSIHMYAQRVLHRPRIVSTDACFLYFKDFLVGGFQTERIFQRRSTIRKKMCATIVWSNITGFLF